MYTTEFKRLYYMTQTEFISKRLDGKIEVITGGNSGIGLATAQRFVQEGAYVFITGRRQDELDKAVKQIGRNVTAVQGYVSNLADLDRLYETVKQQGKIDVLFANAGLWEFTPSEEITETLKGFYSPYKRPFHYLRTEGRSF